MERSPALASNFGPLSMLLAGKSRHWGYGKYVFRQHIIPIYNGLDVRLLTYVLNRTQIWTVEKLIPVNGRIAA
jgi:hypothetical protein